MRSVLLLMVHCVSVGLMMGASHGLIFELVYLKRIVTILSLGMHLMYKGTS